MSAVTARFFTDSGSLLQSGAEVETALHAGEHVQHTLGMFRYFLKHSVLVGLGGGGGEKSSSVAAAGWSKGAGLNLTSANTLVSRDLLGVKSIS